MFRKSKIKSSLITVDDQPKAQVVAPKKEIPAAKEKVGFKFHYIFYTNSGKETYFTLEYPLMPFSLELSEHVFSTKGFHTFFTRTF